MLTQALFVLGQVSSLAALAYGAWTVLSQNPLFTARFWLAPRAARPAPFALAG